MSESGSGKNLSRRELLNTTTLIALLAATGGITARKSEAQTSDQFPDTEEVKQTLIERLLNTRYYIADDGSVVVLPHDEVWPGDSGGAYHADWLFNTIDGLKADPHAALEQTIVTDIEHTGVPADCDLNDVQQILDCASKLGILDDFNLIYHVLKEKIHVETEGAHTFGVRQFNEWVKQSDDYTLQQKRVIEGAVVDFLSRPFAHDQHEFY